MQRTSRLLWRSLITGTTGVLSLSTATVLLAEDSNIEQIVVTGKYIENESRSAMKMELPRMDTPFSVQSYSEAFADSIEANTLGDMFNYMTGVKKAGLTGVDISFRGFKSGGDDRNSILVDGMPGLSGRYGSPPSVNVESIELVRGSMSVLYGQNQPGGFINIVTKKPQYERKTSVGLRMSGFEGADLSLGDAPGYRVDIDTTGHFDQDGKLLYRFVGEYNDTEGFRDFTFDEGTYLAPSLTWNIGASTSVTAQFEYRETESSFDQGLVAPGRDIRRVAPVTTYYSEPGSAREETGMTGTLSVSHTFANDWQWNTSVRTVDYESEQREFSHVGVRPDGRTLNRRARHLLTERSYNTLDTNLTMQFDTGAISHRLIAGVTAGESRIDENRAKFFNSVCPGEFCFDIDIYNPVYRAVPAFDSIPAHNPATPHLLTNRRFESEDRAFYISDLITLTEQWKISLGVRAFEEKARMEDRRDLTVEPIEKTSKDSFLPMAGLVFQPTDGWSLYASYSESYVPADPDDVDINGENSFDPLMGEQIEVGAKVEELLDGRLTASLALFQITQNNMLNSFSCAYGVCYNQLGEARSEGVELEANISPTDNWQLLFGYAYTDARITKSNVPVQVGAQLANAPKHTANLWSSYDFNNGFILGAGVAYVGEYQGIVPSASDATLMPMPSYTIADVALTYDAGSYSLNLKVGNLFDEVHYEGTGLTAPIQIVAGPPRNVTLSARFNF